MPIRLVAALSAITLLVMPAAGESTASRDACDMISPALLQETLGDAQIVEQSGAGSGISLCYWRNGDGHGIKLHSITATAQGIVGGTPLDYFLQHQANAMETMGADNATPIEGPWQAAYVVDVQTEPNPQKFYSVTLINVDDTVTVDTYGLSRDATVSLASAVAEAM